MAIALRFAIELVHQIDGYTYYDEIQHGFDILDDVILSAREYAEEGAIRFAEANKNEVFICTGPRRILHYLSPTIKAAKGRQPKQIKKY